MNRIRQIYAELRELELRREALEAERGKLIAAEREDSGMGFTPSEKIALFLSLFRCREDVYPRLWENAKDGRGKGMHRLVGTSGSVVFVRTASTILLTARIC